MPRYSRLHNSLPPALRPKSIFSFPFLDATSDAEHYVSGALHVMPFLWFLFSTTRCTDQCDSTADITHEHWFSLAGSCGRRWFRHYLRHDDWGGSDERGSTGGPDIASDYWSGWEHRLPVLSIQPGQRNANPGWANYSGTRDQHRHHHTRYWALMTSAPTLRKEI